MALNFNQMGSMAGGNSVGNVLSSVSAGLPSRGEKLSMDVQNSINTNLKSLVDLSNTDIDSFKDADFNVKSAFQAWNDLSSGWGKRERIAAQRAGINPLSFKKQYDGYQAMMIKEIENNIKSNQNMTKSSDSDMRSKFSNMPNLANYLSNNSVDPLITSMMTPKRTALDQISDFGSMLIPKADDTLGELAMSGPGIVAQGLGARALYNRFFGGGAASGGAAAGTGAGGAASPILGPDGNPLPKSSKSKLRKGAANLLSKAKGKAPSMKSASSLLTKYLGKSRGLAMLARFGPYGALAALIGGAGLALYSNRDNYQSAQDARVSNTYGGGPVDTSGAAGIEAARAKLAPYLK